MSREGKLVKNTIILAVGTFFPKMVIFITLPILTFYLTQDEYGTYDLVLTLVALLLPAATLQIHSAAFRYLIDAKDDDEKATIVSNIFAFVIPVSLITLVIMFFLMRNQYFSVRIMICAYLFFDILVNTNRQIIRGLLRNIDYAVSAFISSVGQIVLILLLVLILKMSLLGALIALTVAEIIASIYLLIRGHIYKYIDFSKVSFEKLKEYLGYSWPMVPNSLSQWVMHASDKLVIVFYMSLSASAIFAVAYKIPSIISFAQTTFNMAWQENATIVSKDDDVANYYSTMFEWLFDIVSGCMAILIGITPVLFALLVKGDYQEAYYHMPILFMGMLFFSLSSFWGGIFVAYKKTKSVGTTTVLAALIHLVIVFAFIQSIGLYAASLATLVSYVLLCVFRLVGVQKLIELKYKWLHIIIVCIVLSIQCIICFQRVFLLDIINFILGVIVGVCLNRELIKVIFKKIFKKFIS